MLVREVVRRAGIERPAVRHFIGQLGQQRRQVGGDGLRFHLHACLHADIEPLVRGAHEHRRGRMLEEIGEGRAFPGCRAHRQRTGDQPLPVGQRQWQHADDVPRIRGRGVVEVTHVQGQVVQHGGP